MNEKTRLVWAAVFGAAVVQKYESEWSNPDFKNQSEYDQSLEILGESVYLADLAVTDLTELVDTGVEISDNAIEMVGGRICRVNTKN